MLYCICIKTLKGQVVYNMNKKRIEKVGKSVLWQEDCLYKQELTNEDLGVIEEAII